MTVGQISSAIFAEEALTVINATLLDVTVCEQTAPVNQRFTQTEDTPEFKKCDSSLPFAGLHPDGVPASILVMAGLGFVVFFGLILALTVWYCRTVKNPPARAVVLGQEDVERIFDDERYSDEDLGRLAVNHLELEELEAQEQETQEHSHSLADLELTVLDPAELLDVDQHEHDDRDEDTYGDTYEEEEEAEDVPDAGSFDEGHRVPAETDHLS
eukprot:CAMPEP_0177634084 /NCGR_PEP_ID=MMETSP0447-20121125/3182_1 /TAXON_ID=0 /ORGANISM="Stygamoeba regulata, Strain BSH-02190019" /LENGTH=213 /DNA_ID=CAMNT_0019135787 /DNA_START=509 /DNA_END=1150 /DNA_ORIENTATION=+